MELLELTDRPAHRRSVWDLEALQHFEQLLADGPQFGDEGRRRTKVLEYLTELRGSFTRRVRVSWVTAPRRITIRRRGGHV